MLLRSVHFWKCSSYSSSAPRTVHQAVQQISASSKNVILSAKVFQQAKPSDLAQSQNTLLRFFTTSKENSSNYSRSNFSKVDPKQIPDSIVFEHKYRPIRYPFWKPFFAKFAVWSVMRSYPGSSVPEITDGALQAFKAIYSILNPSSANRSLPPQEELEKMLEPHIVKQLRKQREQPDPVHVEVALVSVKKIVLADCKMGLVFRKDANPPDSYKSMETRAVAPRFIAPVFIITTEEEIKSVGGVEQRSRTRFFQMDHIYGFRTLLPPMAHYKALPISEALEKTPIHWRVAMLRSDYGALLGPQQEQKSAYEHMPPPQ